MSSRFADRRHREPPSLSFGQKRPKINISTARDRSGCSAEIRLLGTRPETLDGGLFSSLIFRPVISITSFAQVRSPLFASAATPATRSDRQSVQIELFPKQPTPSPPTAIYRQDPGR